MITQEDIGCEGDCMFCRPARLTDHVHRKRGKSYRGGKNPRHSKAKPYWMPYGAKRLERKRTRSRERDTVARDPESMPSRDTPHMRWNLWNWD